MSNFAALTLHLCYNLFMNIDICMTFELSLLSSPLLFAFHCSFSLNLNIHIDPVKSFIRLTRKLIKICYYDQN